VNARTQPKKVTMNDYNLQHLVPKLPTYKPKLGATKAPKFKFETPQVTNSYPMTMAMILSKNSSIQVFIFKIISIF
jgi:hypothetical protein